MKAMNSILSIGAGFLTVVVLSVGTDAVAEGAGLFPPQSQPELYTGSLLLIALTYRMIYTIAGGYVTARLAKSDPMRKVIILGVVGIIAGAAGAAATWNMTPEHWYPVALVVTALPCTWMGGKIRMRTLAFTSTQQFDTNK